MDSIPETFSLTMLATKIPIRLAMIPFVLLKIKTKAFKLNIISKK